MNEREGLGSESSGEWLGAMGIASGEAVLPARRRDTIKHIFISCPQPLAAGSGHSGRAACSRDYL